MRVCIPFFKSYFQSSSLDVSGVIAGMLYSCSSFELMMLHVHLSSRSASTVSHITWWFMGKLMTLNVNSWSHPSIIYKSLSPLQPITADRPWVRGGAHLERWLRCFIKAENDFKSGRVMIPTHWSSLEQREAASTPQRGDGDHHNSQISWLCSPAAHLETARTLPLHTCSLIFTCTASSVNLFIHRTVQVAGVDAKSR